MTFFVIQINRSQSSPYRFLVNANYVRREDSQRGVTTVAVLFLQR